MPSTSSCFALEPLSLAGSLPKRVLVIDHHDSFTYNLVHLLASLGVVTHVMQSDDGRRAQATTREMGITDEEGVTRGSVRASDYDAILLSPGPCGPERAHTARAALTAESGRVPFLGVCLGHQVIAEAFGARVVRVKPVHGKPDLIEHDGVGLYLGLPNPFRATRYHSLAVDPNSVPQGFEVSAWASDGTIMGLRHRSLRLDSVQFHPESVASTHGAELMRNWLAQIPIAARESGI